MPLQAIVFDLDGVLIDSEPVWEEVRRAYVAELGGRWAPDAQERMMGMSTDEWADYIASDLVGGLSTEDVAYEVIDRMSQRYAEHLPVLPARTRPSTGWPSSVAGPRQLVPARADRHRPRPARRRRAVPRDRLHRGGRPGQTGPGRLPHRRRAARRPRDRVRRHRGLVQRPALRARRRDAGDRDPASRAPARAGRPGPRRARRGRSRRPDRGGYPQGGELTRAVGRGS